MWYHITYEYLGYKVVLNPNVPDNQLTDKEGNIPRICVSSSIYKCLRALHGLNYIWIGNYNGLKENPCVYFTENVPYIPPNCGDFRCNDERWFLNKTEFQYLGRIDIYKLFRYNKIVPTFDRLCKLPLKNKNECIYEKGCTEIFLSNLIQKENINV